MHPIGYVKSTYKEKFTTPRQSGLVPESRAQIILESWVQPEKSLAGLETFSHIWVLFQFHDNKNKTFHAKVLPPRHAKKVGVFATRSPHRPNPIGLSMVRLEKIEGAVVYISGVDVIDGTPVLDLKPYLPAVDNAPDATSGWTEEMQEPNLDVAWTAGAASALAELADGDRVRRLVENTLRLDPRPKILKGSRGLDYKKNYGATLEGFEVKFHYLSDTALCISQIYPR